ncbi:MAG: hypothetical protein HY648_10905 [Acidobacteria bacterium]|nr:hypothetical protein [Acidobacteriota bacterium]
MKKSGKRKRDELLPEYDFARMPGGVKGKYIQRYRQGANLALLDRDVAEAFPDDKAVNDALRAVLKAAERLPQQATPKGRRRMVAR